MILFQEENIQETVSAKIMLLTFEGSEQRSFIFVVQR